MTSEPKYALDPEIRAKLLASLLPLKAGSEKLSEAAFADIFCDFPDLAGIKQCMQLGDLVEVLEQGSKAAYNKSGQKFRNQIDDANHKIKLLKQEIEKEELLIVESKKQLKNCLLNSSEKRGPGNPPKSLRRNDVTKQLLAKWILALQVGLGVTSCTGIESMMDTGNKRNWQGWLKGTRVPSSKNFLSLLSSKITEGKHKGKTLANIPLTSGAPSAHTLFKLLCRDEFGEESVMTFVGDEGISG